MGWLGLACSLARSFVDTAIGVCSCGGRVECLGASIAWQLREGWVVFFFLQKKEDDELGATRLALALALALALD